MLKKMHMQEIQDLKLRGYSMNEIIHYFEERGRKPPSLPTLRKYFKMEALPEVPNQNLIKDKVFDHEPYRSAILSILQNNQNSDVYISSIYDVLTERFVESGEVDALPGNEQTLRNYVHHLRKRGQIEMELEPKRSYDYVFDTPPGEQMLVDFGQQWIASGVVVHFICLLLRYSRILHVFAQDHKFSAEEASRALYRSFCKLGGRPAQLVIDQDAVFVASETYGEVIKTRIFEDFCTEQELSLWVCNKADPESKGPIENSVHFVKMNFFSARTIETMDEVWTSLPSWVERKNKRIHKSTFRVPNDVFETIERETLRPNVSSFYENSPSSYISVDINSLPYVQYRSSKYSVPYAYCFSKVHYKAIGSTLHIYDDQHNLICQHAINACKGSINQLPDHRRPQSEDWIQIVERLRVKWNCYDFQHFINGFKKENPRHLARQLSAVERFLDAEQPERELVAQVMDLCCRDFRYRYTQFKAVFALVKAGRSEPKRVAFNEVQKQDLEVYQRAFARRCEPERGSS